MVTVLVTGGTGLVGKALHDIQHNYEKYTFIYLSSKDCDLTDYASCIHTFQSVKPTFVIHLAAFVGGLYKNMNDKTNMFDKNILININVVRACHELKVKKLVSCLSTCIFPDDISYPISEHMLHDGPPHQSNYCYAYAKRMLEVQSRAYREQHGDNFICLIPTNLYGKYDNFSLTDSHVVPGLIHACYLAKKNNKPFVVKGTGKPLRQFMYSIDFAELIMWSLENYNDAEPLIVSPNKEDEISIKEVANIIASEFNMENIEYDHSHADGQYKKTADNSKLANMLNYSYTPFKIGIQETIKWFINNYDTIRK